MDRARPLYRFLFTDHRDELAHVCQPRRAEVSSVVERSDARNPKANLTVLD
jgi:hypothetical protein